jgi:hypothetical protein
MDKVHRAGDAEGYTSSSGNFDLYSCIQLLHEYIFLCDIFSIFLFKAKFSFLLKLLGNNLIY